VTGLQGWPIGPDQPRPFSYPPTALLLFAPLSLAPWKAAYAVWAVAGILALGVAGRRAGAPLWLLFCPWVAFAAYCGQVTPLIAAAIALGLAERRTRPLLAGVVFGVAAAIKPQALLLLPVALLAERSWRVIAVTAATAAAMAMVSLLIWGMSPWIHGLEALPAFANLIRGHEGLTANSITPSAALRFYGLSERWALLLLPLAVFVVWRAFRAQRELADQLFALVGATFLVSPYALNYELALFAPATAIYLTRTHDRVDRLPGCDRLADRGRPPGYREPVARTQPAPDPVRREGLVGTLDRSLKQSMR
jgi:hypothetical protein